MLSGVENFGPDPPGQRTISVPTLAEELPKPRGQFKYNHRDTQMSVCLGDVRPCSSEFISLTMPGAHLFPFGLLGNGPGSLHPALCPLMKMGTQTSGYLMKFERESSE